MREEPLGKEDVMSKSSRRNRRDQLQKQELEEVRKEVQQNPRVNPVPTEKKANGKNKVPPTRKQSPYVTETQEVAQVEIGQDVSEPMMPDWVEKYLHYQADFTRQISEQIVEDHRVIIDHGYRLDDIETLLGIVSEPVKPMEVDSDLKPEPEPEPKLEPEPEPELQKAKAKKLEPASPTVLQPDAVTQPILKPMPETEEVVAEPETAEPVGEIPPPKDAIPREMYEAQSFEKGKWRLRGPYKRISQAEQVAKGDLSKVKIVQVWWDAERDIVLGYLSAEEIDCYCK